MQSCGHQKILSYQPSKLASTLRDLLGTFKNGYQKGHSHAIKDLETFPDYVEQYLDFTQDEMTQHYQVCKKTIRRAIKKIVYTRKKVKLIHKEMKREGPPTFNLSNR